MNHPEPPIFNRGYYERVLKENGYEDLRNELKPIDFSLGGLTSGDLSVAWLCHDEGDLFAQKEKENPEQSKVITGIGLSGTPHLGTLAQMIKSIRLQKEGRLAVKFVLGDLDAFNGKGTPMAVATNLAKKVKKFMLELGFDHSGRNELESQFDELGALRTTYLAGHFMEDADFNGAEEDLHAFYAEQGKVDHAMSFRRKLSLALMVGGWYHQQAEKGEKNLLIALGIDEHKYVRFSKTVLSKMQQSAEYGEVLRDSHISGMYSSIIRGFNGYPKMSKSFSGSGITLDMTQEQIADLIMKGEGQTEEVEDNVVFQCMANASLFPPEKIRELYQECKQKSPVWVESKKEYVHHLYQMISLWQKTLNE